MNTTAVRPRPGQVEDRNRPDVGDLEHRSAPTAAPTVEGRRVRGVIPYGVESRDLGGFREIIDPGALRGARLDDLIATVDHGGVPIGRHPGTLALEDRADGLHWSLDLPESRSDVREAIQRGDLCAGSWRMIVGEDRWDGDVRHVVRIDELRDVTVVSTPAYAASVLEHRSAPVTPPAGPTPGPAPRRGGLRVEERTGDAGDQATVETRILDAIRAVAPGEVRSLATTNAAPIAPPELSTFLFDRLRPSSVALASGIRVIATSRDTLQFPKLTGDATPGFFNEGQAITPSDPTFAALTATPRKLAALIQLTNEVVDDSDPSIVNVIQNHLGVILGAKLDLAVFEGSGTVPEIRGLKNVAGIQTLSLGANGSTFAAAGGLDPIADAIALLEAANATPGAIAMTPRSWNAIRKLKDTTGALTLGDGTGQTTRRLFGVPVFVSSQLSTTETQGTASTASSVYVYDASQVVLVRRTDSTIELDRSRLFNQDMSELRGKLRADLLVPNPPAVVRIQGAL